MVRAKMKLNLRKVLAIILFLIVVAAIVLALIAREDLYGMLHALRDANYGFVALAVGTYTLSTVFWSVRWRTALSAIGHTVGVRDLYLVVYGSIFINNLTPLTRVGGDPVGRAYLLQKTKGVPYALGFASIVSEYLLDFPVFLSLLALGLLMYLGAASIWPVLAIIGIWASVTILLVPVSSRILKKRIAAGKIGGILMRVLKSFRRRVDKARIAKGVEKFYGGAHTIVSRWRIALSLLSFSAALWSFDMLRLFFVFKALGQNPPIAMLMLASTLPSIAGWVPLLPGGLGLVDATLVSVFTLFGFPLSIAIAATLIERAISYVFSSIIGAGVLSYLGIRVWAR